MNSIWIFKNAIQLQLTTNTSFTSYLFTVDAYYCRHFPPTLVYW